MFEITPLGCKKQNTKANDVSHDINEQFIMDPQADVPQRSEQRKPTKQPNAHSGQTAVNVVADNEVDWRKGRSTH